MHNYYFKDTIESFLNKSTEEILGSITVANPFDATLFQNLSWEQQIPILKKALSGYQGTIFFEFSVPRMGKRIDCLVIIDNVVFVIEFKVGENQFHRYHVEQVWDYALDLKNFHKPSHHVAMAPILVATEAEGSLIEFLLTSHNDKLLLPINIGKKRLADIIHNTLQFFENESYINVDEFASGSYFPTPTIIEAAISLYNNHTVEEITRSDAKAINLTKTTAAISSIIDSAKARRKKTICFVTGVPGAGKTLVGLKVATTHLDKEEANRSVYLSGNAPLVAILQEALTRDKIQRELDDGNRITKGKAKQAVKTFIQIIHHYRDEYLVNTDPPYDHVAIFDEAQRAWNKEQTVKFMRLKKKIPDFDYSEPEFLISCLNRHQDWAVIICLVGGGQEIHTGEAGISEWLNAIDHKFPDWEVFISPNLSDSEYAALDTIKRLQEKCEVTLNEDLHLSVSLRSFRAENLSLFVKHLLDREIELAQEVFSRISENYPIVITRNFQKAKDWLREKARGSERYGMIVSSQAQRLKPYAIYVKSPVNPVNWFLNDKDDVRSSYYLEDVATEFHIQGLELDWACVSWDGDLRFSEEGWKTYSFKGSKWQNINKIDRKRYLINAYRVLLTRARQGMVIVVPKGDSSDPTRDPEYYNSTYNYLKKIGLKELTK
ncbi:MAG: DUF2075 domain-containing protein [Bacteroidales bacterium]|nr:DUF2075 domain-containing protein [Bacteroidales bacterium]